MTDTEARPASSATYCNKVTYKAEAQADAPPVGEYDGRLPIFEEAGYRKSEIFCGAPLTRVLPE
jgi:hypothetical protein